MRAAVQLLKVLGAQVTATCDTRHREPVRGLGADRVVDYTAGDFTRDAQSYDVVFDAVGKSSFLRCRRLLKPRGSYLWSDLGPMWQNMFFSLITPLFGRRKSLFRPPRHDQETVRYLRELLESGAFRPLIDRRVPAGADRGGVPVRRDGAEDRQRRDRRRACELVTRSSLAAGRNVKDGLPSGGSR